MLKLNKTDLISYASAFVSFILKSLRDFNIKEIILFGSIARGDFDKKSDIDIFINIQNDRDSNKINKIIDIQLNKFYKSKIRGVWLNKGIYNEFKVKVGVLDKWKLKRSIIADGIILFGRYKAYPKEIKHYYLFTFQPIKDVTKRNRVIRKIFGRMDRKAIFTGLVEEGNGKKLSPTSFIVPIDLSNRIFDIFKKEKINYRFYEIWSDQFRK